MEAIDKPHTGKYKEITNYSNYDASCTLTSLPVWDLENFKRLIFYVQSVQSVPQSFTPGPLLYNIFINDCTNIHHSALLLFADDTIQRVIKSIKDCRCLQSDHGKEKYTYRK
jgi:hypothetical protein